MANHSNLDIIRLQSSIINIRKTREDLVHQTRKLQEKLSSISKCYEISCELASSFEEDSIDFIKERCINAHFHTVILKRTITDLERSLEEFVQNANTK